MTLRVLLACLLLLLPSPAFAWWDYGHQTIARIAWAEASPRARAELRRLLARADGLGTPRCPARTLAQLSTWADCIKPLRALRRDQRLALSEHPDLPLLRSSRRMRGR